MHDTDFRRYLRNYDFWTYAGLLGTFWFSYGLLFPIFTLYLLTECSLSLIQVGQLSAYFWVLMIFFQVPTGAIADHFGRKRAFLYATTCTSFAIVSLLYARTFWMFLASQTLFAISRAFFDGAMQAWIIDRMRLEGRKDLTRIVSIEQGLFGLGIIIGGFTSDALAIRYDTYRAPLIAMFCAILVITFAGALCMRDGSHRPSDPLRRGKTNPLMPADIGLSLKARMILKFLPVMAPVYSAAGVILRQPILKVIMCIGAAQTMTFSAIATYWPVHFAEIIPHKGFAGKFSSLFTLMWFIGGLATFILVSAKKKEPRIFLSGSLIGLVGHAALCFGVATENVYVISIGLCGFYYSFGALNPILKRYLNECATPNMRATLMSFYCISCAAGTAYGQWLASIFIERAAEPRYGFFWTWLAASVIFLAWNIWLARKLTLHNRLALNN